MARVYELLDWLGEAHVISMLDLTNDTLTLESRDKTTFNTASGCRKYQVLLFGLCSAPDTF